MMLAFTKMQGLGNDVVVVDDRGRLIEVDGALARRLADRRLGIGCDQLLFIGPPLSSTSQLSFRIFNADGGEVEHCGNGARCVARYARDRGLVDTDTFGMDLPGGLVVARVGGGDEVAIDMGEPDFRPESLPFRTPCAAEVYTLEDVAGGSVNFAVVSMGNPHAVIEVADVAAAPVLQLGRALQAHAAFPRSVNVGFVERLGAEQLRLRVFERGVGETLACGTGACAAMAALRRRGDVAAAVTVTLPGGSLRIDWQGPGHALWMTGPASFVFNGEIDV